MINSPSSTVPAGTTRSAAAVISGKRPDKSVPFFDHNLAWPFPSWKHARNPSHFSSYRLPPGMACGPGIRSSARASSTAIGPANPGGRATPGTFDRFAGAAGRDRRITVAGCQGRIPGAAVTVVGTAPTAAATGGVACSPASGSKPPSSRSRPNLRRFGRREVAVTCGFVVRGWGLFCRRRLRWGSAEGGGDGCADELEDAALDGGGFGQGGDDGSVRAVLQVVAGEGGQVS